MSWGLFRVVSVCLFGVSEKRKQIYYCEDRWSREGQFTKRRRSHNDKSIYEVVSEIGIQISKNIKLDLFIYFLSFTNSSTLNKNQFIIFIHKTVQLHSHSFTACV